MVAIAADGQSAGLWDSATGVALRDLFPHRGITCVAFSPDGKRLFTGGDKAVRAWDIEPLPAPANLENWIATLTKLEKPGDSAATADEESRIKNEKVQLEIAEWNITLRQRQAKRCRQYQWAAAKDAEQRGEWFAAEFHLRNLLQADPENAQLSERLRVARDHLK